MPSCPYRRIPETFFFFSSYLCKNHTSYCHTLVDASNLFWLDHFPQCLFTKYSAFRWAMLPQVLFESLCCHKNSYHHLLDGSAWESLHDPQEYCIAGYSLGGVPPHLFSLSEGKFYIIMCNFSFQILKKKTVSKKNFWKIVNL